MCTFGRAVTAFCIFSSTIFNDFPISSVFDAIFLYMVVLFILYDDLVNTMFYRSNNLAGKPVKVQKYHYSKMILTVFILYNT